MNPTPAPLPEARNAELFGDGVWLVMSAGLVAFVARFGVDLPYMDEWPTVDALTNRAPLLKWLWERHNEHLLPVPRLLYWGLFQAAGDMRAGMFASAVGWAILARVLMAAARNLRGRPAYADAAFPLLFLHWGQWENALMSYQVCFMLSALLAGVTLAIIVRPDPGPGRVLAAAACTAILPLCGGHGLLFAAGGMGWLASVAANGWVFPNGRTNRRTATAAGIGLAAVLAVVSLYATAPPTPPPAYIPPFSLWKFAAGWFGFGAAGYGLAAERFWPAAAMLPAAAGIAVVVCMWRSRRAIFGPDRLPYLGLLFAVLAGWLLAAAISWGRSRFGMHSVFFPRYVGLAAFIPATAVLAWTRFGPPVLTRFGPAALTIACAAVLPVNLWLGWQSASHLERIQSSAREELNAGVPVEVVARKYHFLIYNNPAIAAAYIEKAANAGVGGLKPVAHEPECETILLPLSPARTRDVRSLCENGWTSTGPAGCLEYDLPEPRFAHAVAIRGRYPFTGFWPPVTARVEWWSNGGSTKCETFPVFRFPTPDLGDPALIVWVNGPVSGFRVVPGPGRWTFQITAIELLVPPGAAKPNEATE